MTIKTMRLDEKNVVGCEDWNEYAAELYIQRKRWRCYKRYIRKIYFIEEPFRLVKENKLRFAFDYKKLKMNMGNKIMWEFYAGTYEDNMNWLLNADNPEQKLMQKSYVRKYVRIYTHYYKELFAEQSRNQTLYYDISRMDASIEENEIVKVSNYENCLVKYYTRKLLVKSL
jgi:hypothetical protein